MFLLIDRVTFDAVTRPMIWRVRKSAVISIINNAIQPLLETIQKIRLKNYECRDTLLALSTVKKFLL